MDIFIRTGIGNPGVGFVIPNGDPDACWEWVGYRHPAGYGLAYSPELKRTVGAHRLVWAMLHGPLPPKGSGMELDHLCRNPMCVNPGHLELVAGAENRRRSTNPAFAAAKHGSASKYNQGCRCDGCREAMRVWQEKRRNLQNPFRRRYKKRGQLPLQSDPPEKVGVEKKPRPVMLCPPALEPSGAERWKSEPPATEHQPWRKWFCTCDKCQALARAQRKKLPKMYPKTP